MYSFSCRTVFALYLLSVVCVYISLFLVDLCDLVVWKDNNSNEPQLTEGWQLAHPQNG